jgi:hypothetical protein
MRCDGLSNVAAYCNMSPNASRPLLAQQSELQARQTELPHNDRSVKQHWLQFVIPSVPDLLFAALLLGLSCGAGGRLLLRDSDIGWHIRNGEQILASHTIPRTDPFSSNMSGHAWYAWEWLYDIAISAIHHVSGLNGVVFFGAAVIAATFVLTLRFTLRRGGNLVVTFLLLVLSLAASAVHFLARPHLLSWLFTVIWFELLDSAAFDDQSRDRLYWLPALTVLWVNLHGGFVLGFALLAIYLIGGAIEYFAHRERREETTSWLKQVGMITALTFVASFINPYGHHLHVHIYRYLSDRFLMSQISEFLSPDFHGAAQQCFAVLLIVTIVAVASAAQKLAPSRVLVLLLAAYSGLYATRNLPTSSLLITLIIAPLLSDTVAQAAKSSPIASWLRRFFSRLDSFGSRMSNVDQAFKGHVWIGLVLVLGLWACWHQGRVGATHLINAYFDDKRFPVEAGGYISGHEIEEPIFSLDYWGGYLIYRLYPDTKVVIDDRHDFYGDQFIKNYLKIVLVQSDWEKQLDQMQVNWILAPRWSSLANMLRLTTNWTAVHEDGTAALFHRVQ